MGSSKHDQVYPAVTTRWIFQLVIVLLRNFKDSTMETLLL
jgi:hypothetical protein